VDAVAFILETTSTADGVISYQTKVEDGEWKDQPDVKVQDQIGMRTRREGQISGPTTGHKFQIRITSMSANIKVREIQLKVMNLAKGAFSE
jgi:hypothetical protein